MKIYVIGDSISMHYGPFLEAGLKGFMAYDRKGGEADTRRNPDTPCAANGGDSSMVLSYLQDQARSGGIDADLLLVNCGLHDIKTDPLTGTRQVSRSRYGDNLRAIIDTVADMRVRMVWIRTTPCDDAVHNRPGMQFHRFAADCAEYNQTADRIMREAGVPSLDLHDFTLNLGPELYRDQVHFLEPISRLQAAFITGWLLAFTAPPISVDA